MTFEMINNHSQILSKLASALGKPCMFLSTACCDVEAIRAAAPYLTHDQAFYLMANGLAVLVFDNEESMRVCFRQTVGDDGPTETNPYNGPGRIYALTCDPSGQWLSENT